MIFAKLKTLLRKADARSVEATWRSIGDLLDLFSPAECANYLKNAGHGSGPLNPAKIAVIVVNAPLKGHDVGGSKPVDARGSVLSFTLPVVIND